MPLCPHLTITLVIQYTLISNYYVNCDFRFREVPLIPYQTGSYRFLRSATIESYKNNFAYYKLSAF